MTEFKVTDEAVRVAGEAVQKLAQEIELVAYDLEVCESIARASIEAALPVMFEQCGWRRKTPNGYVVTRTMTDSDSKPLYAIKEPK